MNTLEHSHEPEQIADRLAQDPAHSYLRDFVYGAIDGTVTTFAVVSGVAGAGLSTGIVIVLGAANLIGDGFSMAASNYLGTKTEEQLRAKARRMEERHVSLYPDGEREEIRQIFARKGFSGDDLERVVDVITSDRQQWIDTMITEELGLTLNGPSAIRAAIWTFAAFVLVGLVPLLPFIIQWIVPESITHPFLASTVITGLAFFSVGATKAQFVEQKWYFAGLETLIVGGSAAGLAYLVGLLLSGITST
jgi:VIT1/CCC1 family predicted Fe2+/Mn2+ transporter